MLLKLATAAGMAGAWTASNHPHTLLGFVENTWLRTLLLMLAATLWAGRAELAQLCAPPSRAHAVALASIACAAAALRLAVPAVPFHADNWMHFVWKRVVNEPDPHGPAGLYGDGYGVFLRLFRLPGLDGASTIFLGNRVAGALTPVAMYAATRLLVRDARVALWAALLLAVSPVHARLSASEGMHVIPTFLTLLALMGFRGHARTGNRDLLCVGLSAFSYAVLTRPDAGVCALALPLLYAPRPDRKHVHDPWLIAGISGAAMIGAPLVLLTAENRMFRIESPWNCWQTFIATLVRAGTPEPALAIAAVLGFSVLLERREVGGAFGLMALLTRIQVSGFEQNTANRLQLLCPELPWIVLGATALPMLVEGHLMGMSRLLARIVVTATVLAATIASLLGPFLRVSWGQHREWLFLRRAVPSVNARAPDWPLVDATPDDRIDVGPHIDPQPLPDEMVSKRTVLSLGEFMCDKPRTPALYYRGLNCYEYDTNFDFSARPARYPAAQPIEPLPACKEFEAHFRLTPLVTETIDAPAYWVDDWATALAPLREIGFFRIDPVPGR